MSILLLCKMLPCLCLALSTGVSTLQLLSRVSCCNDWLMMLRSVFRPHAVASQGSLAAACSFIRADLAAVNRSLMPWVVVNGHRPIYPSSLFGVGPQSDLRVAQDLRNALEDLFILHQVSCMCFVVLRRPSV